MFLFVQKNVLLRISSFHFITIRSIIILNVNFSIILKNDKSTYLFLFRKHYFRLLWTLTYYLLYLDLDTKNFGI